MRTLLRIQKITIETTTEDSGVWVHVIAQKVIKDESGETIQVIPGDHFLHFKLMEIALDMFDVPDPITQISCTHSGAAIGGAVDQVVKVELQKKFGGTLEGNNLWL